MTDDPTDGSDHKKELTDLDARLKAIAAKKKKREKADPNGEAGSSKGYQALGELLGGIFGGLGIGWLCDQYIGTKPYGTIAGVLIGLIAAVYLIARSSKDR